MKSTTRGSNAYKSIIIGGGFFGCSLALQLNRKSFGSEKTLLVEQTSALMTQASYRNQARVHGGYHYPRSVLTGLRSQENYGRFIEDFSSAISSNFQMLYPIASVPQAQVSAKQFEKFCTLIGAPFKRARGEFQKFFNSAYVEEVYEVEEVAFDASRLRDLTLARVAEVDLEIQYNTAAIRIVPLSGGGLQVVLSKDGEENVVEAERVYLCTYAAINPVLERSGLPLIPFRQEMTEIVLVEPPEALKKIGVTMMDGPFFSLMPFPSQGTHSFSHVRYTPHWSWSDPEENPANFYLPDFVPRVPQRSHFMPMKKDSSRYMPLLEGLNYKKSLYQTKTVLPRNVHDDGRPILFKRNHGAQGLYCVLGGKMDNIYDVFDEIDK